MVVATLEVIHPDGSRGGKASCAGLTDGPPLAVLSDGSLILQGVERTVLRVHPHAVRGWEGLFSWEKPRIDEEFKPNEPFVTTTGCDP